MKKFKLSMPTVMAVLILTISMIALYFYSHLPSVHLTGLHAALAAGSTLLVVLFVCYLLAYAWFRYQNKRGASCTEHAFLQWLFCCEKQSLLIKQLQESKKLYHMIAQQSEHVLFEYNFAHKEMFTTPNFEQMFYFSPHKEPFFMTMVNQAWIHPDDIEKFLYLFKERQTSKPLNVELIRFKQRDGYAWYQFEVSLLYDSEFIPMTAVGLIKNITREKTERDMLTKKAEMDELTSTFNKYKTKELISQVLQSSAPGEQHALFVIDVDNFKLVNDFHGHLFGDELLSSVGQSIKHLTRELDVVGRFGGDEFVVLFKGLKDDDVIHQKAEAICALFHSQPVCIGEDTQLSCSIGIAKFPLHSDDYEVLFEKADIAMYAAKQQGKSQYCIYHEEIQCRTTC